MRNPPNETVGAVPMCPPERPHSGVSIPKIYALCTGIERWMRPCGAHGRAHRHRPYPSPLYIYTSGAEMHRALLPPFFEIKKCVYRYDFDITVDDIICFKTNYSLGVPWMTPFVLKQVIFWVSPWHRPDLCRPAYLYHRRGYPCHRASSRRRRVSCRRPVCRHPMAFCHPSFSSAAPHV